MRAHSNGRTQVEKTRTTRRAKPAQKSRRTRKTTRSRAQKGLRFERLHTTEGVHPYDEIKWEQRDAVISNEKGEKVFEQCNVEVPSFWSQLATNVVVSKYFRGTLDTDERETSIRQLISRVVDTITAWGLKDSYFASDEDAAIFSDELTHLLINQKLAFNSPVWFNVGVEEEPQCSACFINSVQDSMGSILDLAKTEGMLFKYGSGTGTNLSPIRSSLEKLAGGGEASGPVSFMRGYDAFAGVIKSGGKTRRAAKMVMLDITHPDVLEFIQCKAKEERKAWTLIDGGYDASFNGEAYSSIFFQNSNNSVRLSDEFMRAVVEDRGWTTRAVTDGRAMQTHRARDLWREIALAAHQCGDPGLQFDTTINDWHTCSNTDRIYASNPCSEYMFLNDTACNLASLNLLKYRREDGELDIESFEHAVDITISGMEIIVGNARYPTPQIEKNSHDYRPLGIGYANLGALLMARGLPYDSEAGRAYAATITALLTGRAFRQSAVLSSQMGPFAGFQENRDPSLRVLDKHRLAVRDVDHTLVPRDLFDAARATWNGAADLAAEHGLRNSQLSVLAPTGTIAFMMDCDTTGVEPDIALIKYKKLVGGGMLKIVNRTVPEALERLGYSTAQRSAIIEYVDGHETIEGAPGLKDGDLPVFDCAFRPANGTRSIAWDGHIRMMSAVQPFISGAISKTVNMPTESSVEDIENAYMMAWKLGLKAIAIYRDGCKRSQPLNTSRDAEKEEPAATGSTTKKALRRKRMPVERQSRTHKFSIGGHEGYITAGMYEDGNLGEIFVRMAKEGSVVSGLVDSFATMTSLALQYGVPLSVLVDKFSHTRFEPSGFTGNPEIPMAKSIMDYMFRWLASRFLSAEKATAMGVRLAELPDVEAQAMTTRPTTEVESKSQGLSQSQSQSQSKAKSKSNGTNGSHAAGTNGTNGDGNVQPIGDPAPSGSVEETEKAVFVGQSDAPPCPECGSIMVRNAACYKCLNCGSTSGCS